MKYKFGCDANLMPWKESWCAVGSDDNSVLAGTIDFCRDYKVEFDYVWCFDKKQDVTDEAVELISEYIRKNNQNYVKRKIKDRLLRKAYTKKNITFDEIDLAKFH